MIYAGLGWMFSLGIAWGFGYYYGKDTTEAKYGRAD